MITLIEGRIGSGKSYFAVREILYNYFTFDNEKVRWVPRDDLEVEIYTNIDGFWLAKNLVDVVKAAGGVNSFFTESYQKKFAKLKKHVYVIDEAQKSTWFHRKYFNQEVFDLFDYHRHYGLEIFLITQDIWKMSPGLIGLPEIHIKVQRRSFAVFRSAFTYMYMSDKDILKKMSLKKDPKVFVAYRSQRVPDRDSVKSFSRRFIVIFSVLFLCVVGGFYLFTKSFFWTMERKVKHNKVVVNEKVVVKKVLGVVGDYVYYDLAGKVIKEKRN